ncbi:unnamed protein product [Brassicogethes aeneus]|uniref:Uncharacterized protein n=1 Tax=Brassicogethes aeneus TaxID=1431903 RepID=A0A9P0BA94_BRAAE|nr:unnamed protein product [Brassicogethes aeneus]
MIIFSGNPECPKFAHAVRVAQYLASRLPKFEYKMILKLDMNWKAFLEEINAENDWHFTSSPVIWEEIIPGGKKYKIGELGDFWEYVYNYYGLVSFLSTEELQSIIDENIEAYHDEKCTFVDKPGRRIISICGASSEITDYLLNELINLKSVYTDKGLEIKLHDKNLNDFEVKEKVYDSAYKINHMGIMGKKSFVKPEPDCEQAILGCDLLIFLGEYSPIK